MTNAQLPLISKNIRTIRNSRRYVDERFAFFKKHPLCAICKSKELTTAAEQLDHIIPTFIRPDLFWTHSNWQMLCTPCHKKKSEEEAPQTMLRTNSAGDLEQRVFGRWVICEVAPPKQHQELRKSRSTALMHRRERRAKHA